MERLFTLRENLQRQFTTEWLNYREAIRTGKPFDEAKQIYLCIKDLQQQISDVTNKIHHQLKLGD